MPIDRHAEDPFAHMRVLTIKQVRDLTKFSAQHVYRMERAGNFPARIRLGANRVGWRLAEVEEWFASREVVARPATTTEGRPSL